MRVRVFTKDDPKIPCDVILDVVSKASETRIGCFETGDISALGRLLYGAARVVTTKTLEPTQDLLGNKI